MASSHAVVDRAGVVPVGQRGCDGWEGRSQVDDHALDVDDVPFAADFDVHSAPHILSGCAVLVLLPILLGERSTNLKVFQKKRKVSVVIENIVGVEKPD